MTLFERVNEILEEAEALQEHNSDIHNYLAVGGAISQNDVDTFSSTAAAISRSYDNRLVELLAEYSDNPVFIDAIKGHKKVKDSLYELDRANEGVLAKLWPRSRNAIRNNRIEDLGELIDEPNQLKSRGVLSPDNALTVTIGTAVVAGVSYLCDRYGLFPKDYLPVVVFSAMIATMNAAQRFRPLPVSQADVIDSNIERVRYLLDSKQEELFSQPKN